MGRHLRLWAMDFPPAIALLANAVRFILGDSLPALRLVPALAGALLLILAALAARELGGGRWAQTIAALGVLASPCFSDRPICSSRWCWTGSRGRSHSSR